MPKTKPTTSRFPVTIAPPPAPVAPPVPAAPPLFVYDPSYLDDTVTISTYGPGYTLITNVDADDCATMAGAEALQTWLSAQQPPINTTIQMGWPLYPPQSGDPDVQSTQVPWLSDGKGAMENAGGLIYNFANLPYSVAAATAIRSFALDDTQ
jgi:hypothetical protein